MTAWKLTAMFNRTAHAHATPLSAARVAAVVLNYGTPRDTLETVNAVRRSTRPVQDIVVVDNGSPDASVDFIGRSSGGVTVVRSDRNLGFAGGCNLGIRQALMSGADLVLLLNSDLELSSTCLGGLEAALASASDIGIAGPALLSALEPGRVESLGISYAARSGRMRHLGHGHLLVDVSLDTRRVDGVSGCAMLVKRQVFERLGDLNEDYFFSFEDLDFCLRAKAAGFATVCVPRSRAYHEGGRTIGKRSPRRLYFGTRNHLLLASRAASSTHPAGRALRAASIISMSLVHAISRAEAPVLSGVGAVARGARDFWHNRFGPGDDREP